ncbi:Uncharacterised protein [Klebsiella pneumoniae]|nr:Uncharacterised protein [Klebsiella pneumoniae]
MEATFLLLLFLALLATHHQHVVVESYLDVLLLDTGHFQGNLVLLVGFLDVQGRLQHARPIGWPLRHVQRRKTEAPECVIEQPVDFPMQLQDRADWPARRWQVIALHRQGRDGLLLLLLVLEPVPGSQLLEIDVHVIPPEKLENELLKPFACCDGQCAQATRAARMTSAVHACASPPSLLRLGSDH